MKRLLLGVWLAFAAACACSGGTETGNPPTRGCKETTCMPCPPPITLVLTDAARGGPVAGAVVDDDDEVCVTGADSTICALDSAMYSELRRHELRIEARGYEPATVELDVGQSPLWPCCTCRYTAARKELALVPSSP